MIRGRTRRKTRWVRVATLCSFAVVLTVILAARGGMRRPATGSDIPIGVPARVAPIRAASPGPASSSQTVPVEIPKNWTFEDSIRPLQDDSFRETLSRVVSIGGIVLRNRDVPLPIEGVTSLLGDLLEDMSDARQNGTIAPIEERIDLSRHGREEVLAAIDEYLSGLGWLREVEAGFERGWVPQDAPPAKNRNEHSIRYLVVLALECRAVFDARRGEVETALRSYLNAKRMERLFDATFGSSGASVDWQLQRIVDFAWRAGPLPISHRDLILQELTPSMPWAAATEARLHREVERRRRPATKDSGIDISRPSSIFSRLRSLRESNAKYDALDARVRELAPILARPPWEALPALRDIIAGDSSGRAEWVLIVEEAARRCLDFVLYTELDATKLAFALKDYRHEHGAYPRSAEELNAIGLPPLPTDPACGKSMRYDSDGRTFEIYLPERPPLPVDPPKRVKRLYPYPFRHRVKVWQALE